MKQYTPPVITEYYNNCGECRFSFIYGETGCAYCEHPLIIEFNGSKKMFHQFNVQFPCGTEWNKISIPKWCPLEDYCTDSKNYNKGQFIGPYKEK